MNTESTDRPPQPDKLETVLFPHKFTPSERLAMSDDQNAALEEIVRLDAEAARISREFNTKVKAQYAVVEKLRCALKRGEEQRQREVVTVFDPTAARRFTSIRLTLPRCARWDLPTWLPAITNSNSRCD